MRKTRKVRKAGGVEDDCTAHRQASILCTPPLAVVAVTHSLTLSLSRHPFKTITITLSCFTIHLTMATRLWALLSPLILLLLTIIFAPQLQALTSSAEPSTRTPLSVTAITQLDCGDGAHDVISGWVHLPTGDMFWSLFQARRAVPGLVVHFQGGPGMSAFDHAFLGEQLPGPRCKLLTSRCRPLPAHEGRQRNPRGALTGPAPMARARLPPHRRLSSRYRLLELRRPAPPTDRTQHLRGRSKRFRCLPADFPDRVLDLRHPAARAPFCVLWWDICAPHRVRGEQNERTAFCWPNCQEH